MANAVIEPLYTPALPHFHLIHSVSSISTRKPEKKACDSSFSIYLSLRFSSSSSRVSCWSVLIQISFSVQGKLGVSVLGYLVFEEKQSLVFLFASGFRFCFIWFWKIMCFSVLSKILGTSFVNLFGPVNVRLEWRFIPC